MAGDFHRDGKLDLAVLMQDTGQVWIFTNEGEGTFEHTFTIEVGDQATGLALSPGTGPGLFNLLVGNSFGDILILDGKGDGTFQISGERVSLSVVPNLLGTGEAGVLVANQANNHVTVQAPSGGGGRYTTVSTLGGASSQLAPGYVEWDYLDKGSSLPDAIVVSTGSNAVLVYRTLSITGGVPAFAPPRTYFVGTSPASVTVADVNGDGIPDMLIADQGSNDVSVLFGSDDAQGDWVGIPGPRLRSGGDGPIAVIAADLTGDGIPDLAVINGGSGTITMLPGVGQGFFDDQHSHTLINLSGALAQPPTFVGTTGIGYAVTAGGSLVRFNLNDPTGGASVAFSGQHVLAAQALTSGQILVALASGSVDLLDPQGDGLTVGTVLQAEGGTAAVPSTIDVVTTANGGYNVLVSSQGSDTIFVYGAGAISTGSFAPPGGSLSPNLSSAIHAAGSSLNQLSLFTTVETESSSAETSSATTISAEGSAAVTVSGGVTAGLSLGGFSSLASALLQRASVAILVAVQGNSYVSVPVLDFGAEYGDDAGDAGGRMPALADKYPIGEKSSLMRLILGIEEALREYPGAGESNLSRDALPQYDPWKEDLFAPRPPASLRGPAPDPGDPGKAGQPRAMRDEPDRAPGLLDRVGVRFEAMAGFVAASVFLMPRLAERARRWRFGTRRREAR